MAKRSISRFLDKEMTPFDADERLHCCITIMKK
jgi:hypothetical protein